MHAALFTQTLLGGREATSPSPTLTQPSARSAESCAVVVAIPLGVVLRFANRMLHSFPHILPPLGVVSALGRVL